MHILAITIMVKAATETSEDTELREEAANTEAAVSDAANALCRGSKSPEPTCSNVCAQIEESRCCPLSRRPVNTEPADPCSGSRQGNILMIHPPKVFSNAALPKCSKCMVCLH